MDFSFFLTDETMLTAAEIHLLIGEHNLQTSGETKLPEKRIRETQESREVNLPFFNNK